MVAVTPPPLPPPLQVAAVVVVVASRADRGLDGSLEQPLAAGDGWGEGECCWRSGERLVSCRVRRLQEKRDGRVFSATVHMRSTYATRASVNRGLGFDSN